MNVRGLALRAARIGWVGGALSFALRHFSSALPIHRVYEDADMVALIHPVPSYDPHILVIPKARARTAFALSETLFRAALRAGSEVARRYETPLQMRINGGNRQEVAQAHFHVYPASGVCGMRRADTPAEALTQAEGAAGFSLVFLIGENGIWIDGTEG